jgi:hypothetical protein
VEGSGIVQSKAALEPLQDFFVGFILGRAAIYPFIDREGWLLCAVVKLADQVKIVLMLFIVRTNRGAKQHRSLGVNLRKVGSQETTRPGEPVAHRMVLFFGVPILRGREFRQRANPDQVTIQPFDTIGGEGGLTVRFN